MKKKEYLMKELERLRKQQGESHMVSDITAALWLPDVLPSVLTRGVSEEETEGEGWPQRPSAGGDQPPAGGGDETDLHVAQ